MHTIKTRFVEDDLDAFSADLRLLRHRSGMVPLVTLAQESRVYPALLEAILAGDRLPRPDVLDRIVGALDGDRRAWGIRRDELDDVLETRVRRVAERPLATVTDLFSRRRVA